jgi:hypothetical protein
MIAKILLPTMALLIGISGRSQGLFDFDNAYALTHIGSINGPLAGPGIWAQMLAGSGPGSLAPVGMPAEHLDILGLPSGRVVGAAAIVPGIRGCQTAFVEMLAWDGSRWGTVLSGVPKIELGMTDIVPVVLAEPTGPGCPPETPHFTQSAVVPVPEPYALAIAAMGGLGALLFRAVWKRLERR